MSDSRSAPLSLDLISKTMKELAQEIGEMEPDDPKRAFFLKELSALTQLPAIFEISRRSFHWRAYGRACA